METKPSYLQSGVAIREGCFLPADSGWLEPTGVEVVALMDKAGVSEAGFAKKIGVDARTMRRWRSGETQIPFAVWARLAFLAGYGDIY
jgi:hypothetical protein